MINQTIAVTGASGQLGSLIIKHLAAKGTNIVALVRSPSKYIPPSKKVSVRKFDYDTRETLISGLSNISTLILVSSPTVGKRFTQHKAVIDAAKSVGVKTILYTSFLRASTSPLGLAQEHKQTEEYLVASAIEHVVLRNNWYLENWSGSVVNSLASGNIVGSNKNARVSPATRNDLAEAAANAAARVSSGDRVKNVYELGGETFTMVEFAQQVSNASGKETKYVDMEEKVYAATLASFGVPLVIAQFLANTDAGAAKGGLLVETTDLAELLGRQPESWKKHVDQAVASVSGAKVVGMKVLFTIMFLWSKLTGK
ncbi:UNVERIFIED_CONTAM: hypothetical protein HDU68_002791 [Siphonaria sp. JEL0065]|nr:hypothetical protein HDU68_002791 [Siphonaria sp. JEL0065]